MEFGKVGVDAARVVVAVVVIVDAGILSADSEGPSKPLDAAFVDEALEDFLDFFVEVELEQLFRLLLLRGGSGEATCSEERISE